MCWKTTKKSKERSPAQIDGVAYQILIEADFIVNAAESAYSKENIANFAETIMRTNSAKRITAEVFGL